MQIIINGYNLLRCIRCSGLLSIAECRIRNPDVLRHIVRHDPVIKRDLRNLGIRKHVTEYVWLLHIIQNIHMLFNFKQVILGIQCHRSVKEIAVIIVHYHITLQLLQMQ